MKHTFRIHSLFYRVQLLFITLHSTLLVFSSNCPVSKNLSNEVGMKYRILLLILVKMELFKSHFFTTWQQNAALILLGGKVGYWKKSKKLKSQQKVPDRRSYLTFKKPFSPKSKALEFNDGINQSYCFRFQKFRLVFSFRSNTEMFYFSPWSIRFFKFP